LFTDVPVEEPTPPTESLCSSSSLPPPTPDNTSTTTSPKAPEIITERLLLEVQEAVEEETGSSECLMTEEATRVSPSSLSLLEAAADVASSLEDAVDAVIQSSPRARRRKLQLLENDPMSVLQNGCFSGSSSSSSTWSLHKSDSNGKLHGDWNPHKPMSPILDLRNNFSWSVGHSPGESSIDTHYHEESKEETWDENCRQHLADFAEKLSEKLLEEIDQYQKQTCQQSPRHSKTLAAIEHLDDPYLSRLNEELQDLTKLSEELQERNSYLASLNNNATALEEIQPQFLLINNPLKITANQNPFLETPMELSSSTEDLDLYKHIEKKPEPDADLAISSESADGLSSASDAVLASNSCSRQTSEDITEDLNTCVEVLGKEDDSDLKEEVHMEICDETIPVQLAAEEECAPTVPDHCDAEPSHLLSSIAGSVISLRPGYSMESSDAEQTATSGSECSRRDKTASTLSLGPNSIEFSDAVTGSSSDCSRDMRYADGRTVQCDGRSSSEEAPTRGVALKASTQEPPEILTKTESCASSLSGSTSQESLPSDNGGGAITFHRYYHVFREGELDQLIEKYVENLHIISSYYDHANWCVVAEKVHVWTI
jgi:hypothetical protein